MIHTTKEDEMPPKKSTPGTTIDEMWQLREEKRTLETSIKEIEARLAELEVSLMEGMDANGLAKMTGRKASVFITESVSAQVEDWDLFLAYIYRNKFGHLLHRRVSDPAYRELLEQGKKLPGTRPFTKRRINLRAL